MVILIYGCSLPLSTVLQLSHLYTQCEVVQLVHFCSGPVYLALTLSLLKITKQYILYIVFKDTFIFVKLSCIKNYFIFYAIHKQNVTKPKKCTSISVV